MKTENKRILDLNEFYPKDSVKITSVQTDEKSITIRMKSITHSCKCIKCGHEASHFHSVYTRKVQDLPVLGKTVYLEVRAYEYLCENAECDVTSFVETIDGFLNYRGRMTERCADFVCTLATETSCEGCARICEAMNLMISGDTVIRLLMKRYQAQPRNVCGSIVGVDDFAFKKRSKYGTMIVDEETHRPVALLDGRESDTLKEWLLQNKHVRMITRDRASAYATAIQEILPDAIQIADRFHLHQNLLEIIRNTINCMVPVDMKIAHDDQEQNEADDFSPCSG